MPYIEAMNYRKIIAWPFCHLTFWMGHFCSMFLNKWPDTWADYDEDEEDKVTWVTYYVGFWYRGYQTFMAWSVWLNDWGGMDVWGEPREYKEEDEE